ncbi:MAG: hypothetical protein ACP5D2_03435 [Candidatus Nanoarchaeia archaeon]
MGLFRKKKGMIDVRKMKKQGWSREQEGSQKVTPPASSSGYVDLHANSQQAGQPNQQTSPSQGGFLSFMDNSSQSQQSSEQEGDWQKKVDRRLEELDNKLYKIEQRLELLERKAGLQNTGPAGW